MAVSLGITITQNSQSVTNNSSNITVSVYCVWSSGSYNKNSPGPAGWIKIDGVQYNFNNTFNDNRTSSGSKTLFSKTLNVEHDVEGKKTVYCSASFATGVSSGTITASGSKTLTDIPRFATIESAPNFNDEENPAITYSNPAGASVESLRACISLDGTNADIAYRDISKTGTSYTFNLTDAERDVLRAATTGANSRTVKFYVRSEIGGNYQGSNIERTFTIKNPNPTINPTITDSNSTTVALTGNSSKLVRYYSNAAITIGAAAVKKATLKSQKVTCGGKSLTANGTINAVESGIFEFTATDSRGNTTTEKVTPDFVNYIKLTCSLGNNMPLADGTMAVKVSGNYFNGSFGAASNTLSVYYRYKIAGGSYNSWAAMTVTKSGNTYSATANLTGLDYQTAYVFQAYAVDKLATVNSAEKTVKATPVFDFGENDFKFNVPVYDKFGMIFGNGLASYTGSGNAGIDPNTTLEELILTNLNTPVSGVFFFIKTFFYSGKTNAGNKAQFAIPYNSSGVSLYFRYKASGTWSDWSKAVNKYETGSIAVQKIRLGNDYMQFFASHEDAIAYANIKGWIGFNGGSTFDINSEQGGAVRVFVDTSAYAFMTDRFRGMANDAYYLGDATYKWKAVYAVNGTIQTSDRNDKTNIQEIEQRYIDLFDKLIPVSFEFVDNESDRVHIGFISQDVKAAMDEVGLTDLDFAGYCRDVKTEYDEETDTEREVLDENGDPVYSYSLRYSEFIALNSKMIQLNRKKIAEQEAEIQSLRTELDQLKDAVAKLTAKL